VVSFFGELDLGSWEFLVVTFPVMAAKEDDIGVK
jgi:hypothetical protein